MGRARAVEERFAEKVDKTDACWLWTAAIQNGYGKFTTANRSVKAHRFAYELLVDPIPTGLTLDHLCRVRHCVNPAHLEPVTLEENLSRIPPRTQCPQGHVYDEANTILSEPNRNTGRRTPRCRTCIQERDRRRSRKKLRAS